ncbi:hypothetical protein P0D87_02110 [Paraburkholderia sp. RL17-368-BIF-A]|jgi:hypothetical protein|nr:hypothetical protein [Burkholderia sp.]
MQSVASLAISSAATAAETGSRFAVRSRMQVQKQASGLAARRAAPDVGVDRCFFATCTKRRMREQHAPEAFDGTTLTIHTKYPISSAGKHGYDL